MNLYIYPVDLEDTMFPQHGAWSREELGTLIADECAIVSISAVKQGKHDISECERIEKHWRECLPNLIDYMIADQCSCVVWATGPLDHGELPCVFPYMFSREDTSKYHIEGITFTSNEGYVHGWISFEYNKNTFTEMMKDTRLDFEYTRLYLLILDHSLIDEVIPKGFWKLNVHDILAYNAIAISFHSHFEGCHVLGSKDRISEIHQDGVNKSWWGG